MNKKRNTVESEDIELSKRGEKKILTISSAREWFNDLDKDAPAHEHARSVRQCRESLLPDEIKKRKIKPIKKLTVK